MEYKCMMPFPRYIQYVVAYRVRHKRLEVIVTGLSFNAFEKFSLKNSKSSNPNDCHQIMSTCTVSYSVEIEGSNITCCHTKYQTFYQWSSGLTYPLSVSAYPLHVHNYAWSSTANVVVYSNGISAITCLLDYWSQSKEYCLFFFTILKPNFIYLTIFLNDSYLAGWLITHAILVVWQTQNTFGFALPGLSLNFLFCFWVYLI